MSSQTEWIIFSLCIMEPDSISIQPLADEPGCIPILAHWFQAEWHDFDGRPVHDIEAQLLENMARDGIPITFLAHSGSELVGTVSLDLSDLPQFDHLSPWLASLYVVPKARRAGIGTALVRHVEQFALDHAIRPLYLWTPRSTHLYENCGWAILQRSIYSSHPITLMRFDPARMVQSKRELSQRLAAYPIEGKLAILDALRERTLAIHRANASQEPIMSREAPSCHRPEQKPH